MNIRYVVILVTTKDKKEAEKIARGLLEAKWIACANIIEGVQSLFWWQGKIDSSQEALLVLKTRKILFKKIVGLVRSLHSYQTPEIVALPLVGGDKDYFEWLNGIIPKLPLTKSG